MQIEDIRTIARSYGIHTGNRSKTDLIKAIQSDEGNFECYATTSVGECDQTGCLWRNDCLDFNNSPA